MEVEWSAGWLAAAQVRLLDTVLLNADGTIKKWLYTSAKTGQVSVKEKAQLAWPKISRRFSRFALSHEGNARGPRHVARFLSEESAAVVDEARLSHVANVTADRRREVIRGVRGVQVYLKGVDVLCRGAVGPGGGAVVADDDGHQLLSSDAREATLNVLQRLGESSPKAVIHVEARFVRDDHGELWLAAVRRVLSKDPPNTNQHDDELRDLPPPRSSATRRSSSSSSRRRADNPAAEAEAEAEEEESPAGSSGGGGDGDHRPGTSAAKARVILRPLSDGGSTRDPSSATKKKPKKQRGVSFSPETNPLHRAASAGSLSSFPAVVVQQQHPPPPHHHHHHHPQRHARTSPMPTPEEIKAQERRQAQLLEEASNRRPRTATAWFEEEEEEEEEKKHPVLKPLILRAEAVEAELAAWRGRAEAAEAKVESVVAEKATLESALEALRTLQEEVKRTAASEVAAKQAELEDLTAFVKQLRKTAPPTTTEEDGTVGAVLAQLEERSLALYEAERAWAAERSVLERAAQRKLALAQVEAAKALDAVRAELDSERDAGAAVRRDLSERTAALQVSEAAQGELLLELDRARRREEGQRATAATLLESKRTVASLDRAADRAHHHPEEAVPPTTTTTKTTTTPPHGDKFDQSTKDAALRQLHNKVVFLQSTVAMEMEQKRAAEAALKEARARSAAELADAERRVAESAALKESELGALERQCEERIAEQRSLARHLEAKLTAAQSAYADALHDAAQCRVKEQAASVALQREQAAAVERAATDRAALLALKNQSKEPANKTKAAISDEAAMVVIRRIENEKQYLQAQLSSEATCKGELEAALRRASRDLAEAHEGLEQAKRTAANAAREASTRADDLSRQLRTLKVAGAADRGEAAKQVALLQEGYTKTRDLLRVEQAQLERHKAAELELELALDARTNEARRAEGALAAARDRSAQDARVAREALKAAAAEAAGKLYATEDQLRHSVQLLTTLREAEAALRRTLEDEEALGPVRTKRAARLAFVLGRGHPSTATTTTSSSDVARLRFEGARAFGRWRLAAGLGAAAADKAAGCEVAAAEAEARVTEALSARFAHDARRAADARDAALAAHSAHNRLAFLAALETERRDGDDRVFATAVAGDAMVCASDRRTAAALQDLAGEKARCTALDKDLLAERAANRALAAVRQDAELDRAALKLDHTKARSLGALAELDAGVAEVSSSSGGAEGHHVESDDDEDPGDAARMLKEAARVEVRNRCEAAARRLAEAVDAAQLKRDLLVRARREVKHHSVNRHSVEKDDDEGGKRDDDEEALSVASSSLTRAFAEVARCAEEAEVEAAAGERVALEAARRIRALSVGRLEAEARRLSKLAVEDWARRAKEAERDLAEARQAGEAERAALIGEAGAARAQLEAAEANFEAASADLEASTKARALKVVTAAEDRFQASRACCGSLAAEARRVALVARAQVEDESKAANAAAEGLVAQERRTAEREWRRVVQRAATEAEALVSKARRDGFKEGEAIQRKETESLKKAAERAVEDVRASAARAMDTMRSETKRALEAAAVKADKATAQRVERAVREAALEERVLRDEEVEALTAALDASAAAAAQRADRDLRRLEEASILDAERSVKSVSELWRSNAELATNLKMEREKRLEVEASADAARAKAASQGALLVEKTADDAKAASAEAFATYARKVDAAMAATAAETALRVAAQHKQAEAQHRLAAAEDVRSALDAASNAHVIALSKAERSLEAQEAALAESETRLRRAGETWQEQNDLLGTALADLAETRQTFALRQLRAAVIAKKQIGDASRKHADAVLDAEQNAEDEAALRRRDARIAKSVRQQLENQLLDAERWRAKMHDTLVNHERATLVAHKQRSTELGAELEAIVAHRDGLDADRETLLDYVDEVHAKVRECEEAIHAHSKTSAIAADGRVNIAYSLKKRRLNDDHDALLGDIEARRLALSDLDAKIAEANDRRESKEDEMKALERKLVELLVAQQKKLLTILVDAAEKPSHLNDRDPDPTPR